MKSVTRRAPLTLSSLAMVCALWSVPATAQDAEAPEAGSQTTPAAPAPAAGEPAKPASREQFASDQAYQSYALGMYFGPNNRSFFRGKEVDIEALKAGLQSVFDGDKDFSYAVGASIALQIAHRDAEVDIDQLAAGLVDAFNYTEPKMSRDEQREAMGAVEESLKAKREAQIKASAAANEAKGKAFLEENKKREGVITTDSGLQYEVISGGEGPKPGENDTVTVTYSGTLLDGTIFDRTDDGTPKRLSLKSRYILQGWKEGMLMMSPGAKYKFYIPHELAYGMEPRNNLVGGNETLIMEVELIGAEPPRQAARPAPGVGASAVTPPVRVPLPAVGDPGKATAVTPPVKVEIPQAAPETDARRGTRVTPPVKVEFPKKEEAPKDTPENTPENTPEGGSNE